ncbi:MAG: glycosyltransferase family 4 protein, partial [Actinomyces dentalis]
PALAGRIAVVPNGVPDAGAPAPARERAAHDPLRCVVVGRLSPRKGTMVALEAVARLRAGGADARLDVCGSVFPGYEWFEAELRERAGRADLAGAVAFHGYVSPTRPLLEAADVVLVPSFGESFGNVAVEGMLAGRPVVACDGLGLGEVLSGAPRTGRLVPPGDAAALARAVAELAADPADARAVGAAGRAEALTRFSPGRYREALVRAVLPDRRK